ncbi:MAG: YlbF family regulator [Clostridiales bacterium]|nr:YlbF family regulator [Clostridiales bacterium]
MENILEKARELGQLIAASEECNKMTKLEETASSNPEVSDLYAQYADLRDRMAAAEMEENVNEDALNGMMDQAQELEERINRHPGILELNLARLTFNQMMQRINRALQVQLTGEDEFADEGGCAPEGCAGCSGCGSDVR